MLGVIIMEYCRFKKFYSCYCAATCDSDFMNIDGDNFLLEVLKWNIGICEKYFPGVVVQLVGGGADVTRGRGRRRGGGRTRPGRE